MDSPKALYNKLKRELGESDACCEYIEVLIRSHETGFSSSSLEDLSSATGIRVNSYDIDVLARTTRSCYFMLVTQEFDCYLSGIKAFIKQFCHSPIAREDGEPELKCVFKYVFGMRERTSYYMKFLVCTYYRLIRNQGVHKLERDAVDNAYKQLRENKEQISKILNKLVFPNDPDHLSFDDFITYSRVAKSLAQDISEHIEIDSRKFVENYDMKRFRCLAVNSQQWRRSLGHELEMVFGLRGEKLVQMIDEIAQIEL